MSKPHDECLELEELDAIQMELEVLLSSVSLRYRNLKVDYLGNRKHQKRNAYKGKSGSPNDTKRKRDEKKSSSKDCGRYSHHTKHSKTKRSPLNTLAHSQHTDHISKTCPILDSNENAGHLYTNKKLHKNDVPNKFWLSIEPYCMPITQEDLKILDDLIDDYSEPLVPIIPKLGPHYADRWTSDDRSNSCFVTVKSPTEKEKENERNMSQGICGPLTQRLISAFLEENNGMENNADECMDVNDYDGNDICTEKNSSTSNRAQATSISSLLRSGIDVEKRLKKELLDMGLLESNDFNKEDEVLNEINRVQTELQTIAEYNRNELNFLKTAAKEEIERQEIKNALDRIDQEVNYSYIIN